MNMYDKHSKIVMAIIANGKPLKDDGIIKIPENSEYTIRFKNKGTEDVLVNFEIDGENASGNGYVIEAGKTANIERFADTPRKFKFVDTESNDAILDGKNNNSTPGMIKATFYYRKKSPEKVYVPGPKEYVYIPDPWISPWDVWPYREPYRPIRRGPMWTTGTRVTYGGVLNPNRGMGGMGVSNTSGNITSNLNNCFSQHCDSTMSSTAQDISYEMSNDSLSTDYGALLSATSSQLGGSSLSTSDKGVTVEGGVSNQTFGSTYFEIGELAAEIKVILRKQCINHTTVNTYFEPQKVQYAAINPITVVEEDPETKALEDELVKLKHIKQLQDKRQKLADEIEKLKAELA